MAGPPAQGNDVPDGFIDKFTVLLSAPRELWITYWTKITEVAAYALVNAALMLYLITDLSFADESAGLFVAVFSILITLFTLTVGSLSDAMGIRKTLIIAFGICVVTRFLAAVVGHPILTPMLAFIPMAFGVAMTIPVMVAATYRFTNKQQGPIAFALLYTFMNIGFAIAGKLIDVIRGAMGKDGVFVLPGIGAELSVYETLFFAAAVITVAGMLPVVLFMRPGLEVPREGGAPVIVPREKAEGGPIGAMVAVLKKTGRILVEVFKEKPFYRFLLLLALIVGVKMVFHHMHYTLPPYADREIGYGSRFGVAWGVLNPVMIIILTPIFGALFNRVSSFKIIVVGTFFSAAPCFLLVLRGDTFIGLLDTPLATAAKWFLDIDGGLSPIYFNLLLFAFFFSIGEALWSPRLYEYTASVAPKGREATYMGLSYLPLFFGKLGAGLLAGYLLGAYTPAEGARDSSVLWLIVAAMAIATPVLLVVLKGVIKPKEGDRDSPTDDDGEAEASAGEAPAAAETDEVVS